MNASLFDVLRGRFEDGRSLEAVPPDGHRSASVLTNLRFLFSTRQGGLAHLPDYGLPDIVEVYRDMPNSVEPLRRALLQAVERYEPRLRRVRIEHRATDRHAMRLVFLVAGELDSGERVQFQTTFSSHDQVRVGPWHQP